MDKIEALRVAATKAKQNGYFMSVDINSMLYSSQNLAIKNDIIESRDYLTGRFSICSVIFHHRFAEGFWGKGPAPEGQLPAWQYHLQKMVLEADPLEYIAKCVEGKTPGAVPYVPAPEPKPVAPVAPVAASAEPKPAG